MSSPYPIDLELLAHQGWLSLPMDESDPLYSAFADLFQSSAQFFTLPEEEKMRYKIEVQDTSRASEEGYSHVIGEKSLVTLRKAKTTPTEFDLLERAQKAWKASAEVMRDVTLSIEDSLGMQRGALEKTIGPQLELPAEQTHASLMRMFRYERPVQSSEPQVVSEAHRDLGLLTIVVGHTPGLECWSLEQQKWISCEEQNTSRLSVTIMTGQTLALFTNQRYTSGRHRVLVHPVTEQNAPSDEPLQNPAYRFSLVHALRAHYPVVVSSSDFATPVTGFYAPPSQFSGVPIREIYKAISSAHWNVNIDPEIRRRQQEEALEKTQLLSQHTLSESPQHEEEPSSKRRSFTISSIKAIFKRH